MITVHYKIFRTLNHPNVLAFLGIVSDGSSMTLITNLVIGGNLHMLIFDTAKKDRVGN